MTSTGLELTFCMQHRLDFELSNDAKMMKMEREKDKLQKKTTNLDAEKK